MVNSDEGDNDIMPPQFLLDAKAALKELLLFLDATSLGFLFVSRYSTVKDVLTEPTVKHHARILPHVDVLQAFAATQFESGFSFVHSIASVRQMTVLEATVSGACLEALRLKADRWELPAIRKLQGPLVDFAAASESDRADFIFQTLSQDLRVRLKPGVGKFEPVLDAVGLGGPVADPVRRAILELSVIRNVVVHRNGRLDSKARKECPWLAGVVGQCLHVSHRMMSRYSVALDWYLAELTRRWIVLFSGDRQLVELAEQHRDRALEELGVLDTASSG